MVVAPTTTGRPGSRRAQGPAQAEGSSQDREGPGVQAQKSPTKTQNQATANQVKPASDGFEAKADSSSKRNQQQAMLGSTTAPEKAEAPEHAQAGALEKLGLTAEDVLKAGTNAAPHLEKAAQAVVQGKYDEALGHLKDAATSSPEIAEKACADCAEPARRRAKPLLTDKAVVHELMSQWGSARLRRQADQEPHGPGRGARADRQRQAATPRSPRWARTRASRRSWRRSA